METRAATARRVIDKLKTLTNEQLDEYIKSGVVVVIEGLSDFDETFPIELSGDWKIVRTYPPDANHVFSLFIAPTTRRTGRIWDLGQYRKARTAGLDNLQTKKWLKSKVSQRHDFLHHLTRVVNDDKLRTAYLDFASVGEGLETRQWKRRHNIEDDYSYRYRKNFCQLLQEIL